MRFSAIILLALAVAATACTDDDALRDAATLTGGDPDRGKAAIGRYGCGSCHEIPGVNAARGAVGPPLGGIATRAYLAGRLSNTPANMVEWIQHPQRVERGTAMPDMAVTEGDARDIAAFLYAQR